MQGQEGGLAASRQLWCFYALKRGEMLDECVWTFAVPVHTWCFCWPLSEPNCNHVAMFLTRIRAQRPGWPLQYTIACWVLPGLPGFERIRMFKNSRKKNFQPVNLKASLASLPTCHFDHAKSILFDFQVDGLCGFQCMLCFCPSLSAPVEHLHICMQ